ncbi:MAG TPA: hypothetical protein VGI75_14385 [Pirellulales bacterium]|jgi:hypothetical protein
MRCQTMVEAFKLLFIFDIDPDFYNTPKPTQTERWCRIWMERE